MSRFIALVFFPLWIGPWLVCANEPAWHLPPGFTAVRVAGPPEISFPMFATLDEQGRLYVTESSGGDLYEELRKLDRTCRVSRLEDRDGDGRYEISRVFADGLTPSMGLVWRDGKLFAADPPDLVTLEDTNGDGRADKRTVVLTGFGHTDNGSLHGLSFGPDGWLYFTMGSPDGYNLRGPDGSRARSTTGALLRSRPDGSRVETVATGFENLIEVEFLPDGSIIGNLTWYQRPLDGLRDALIQIVAGGRYPLNPADRFVPFAESDATLPPLALFPAVSHSGLVRYRGGAFPAEMRGELFSAEFNTRKVVRHRLTPKGASYGVASVDFITTEDPDMHFSDVLEDADGSLLVVDTGSWYVQHCPTGRIRNSPARGGIYRVVFGRGGERRAPASAPTVPDLRTVLPDGDATAIAAAARAAGWRGDTNVVPELTALLRSPNLAHRLAAAEALARCGNPSSNPALVEALAGETDAFLEHALFFALHRLADRDTLEAALRHPSFKVQRAALLLLEQPPFQSVTAGAVVARLNADEDRLRDAARWVLLRHPEWGEAGASFLNDLVTRRQPTEADREVLNRFLSRFQTNAPVRAAIARFLSPDNPVVSDEWRVRLLDALSLLDLSVTPTSWADSIIGFLRRGSPAIRSAAIRATAARRVAGATEALGQLGRDTTQPAGLRLDALRELVRRRPQVEKVEWEFLIDQLAPTNHPSLRLGAAEVLTSAKLGSDPMIALLKTIGGDAVIAPVSVLGNIERNGLPAGCGVALLEYLNASLDAGWTFSTDQLSKVQAAVPAEQSARAAALLARVAGTVARQHRQLVELEPLLQGGDRRRGEKVFFEKGQCIVCHRVRANGGTVGPDLSSIGSIRSGRDLLESLVLPSSTIAQGYETLNVMMKDGDSFTGVRVVRSDGTLILRVASGAEMALPAPEIERVDRSKLSLMPEGLLNALTAEEKRDLLAYLQQLK